MADDRMDDLSSELSSVGSLSPPPSPLPHCYPSPASSQESSVPQLLPGGMVSESGSLETDGQPPAKKRRIAEPKPRTTEYLDLKSLSEEHASSQKKQLDLLLKVLRKRRKIVVVAGAGISVSAGSTFDGAIDVSSNSDLWAQYRTSDLLPVYLLHYEVSTSSKRLENTYSMRQFIGVIRPPLLSMIWSARSLIL